VRCGILARTGRLTEPTSRAPSPRAGSPSRCTAGSSRRLESRPSPRRHWLLIKGRDATPHSGHHRGGSGVRGDRAHAAQIAADEGGDVAKGGVWGSAGEGASAMTRLIRPMLATLTPKPFHPAGLGLRGEVRRRPRPRLRARTAGAPLLTLPQGHHDGVSRDRPCPARPPGRRPRARRRDRRLRLRHGVSRFPVLQRGRWANGPPRLRDLRLLERRRDAAASGPSPNDAVCSKRLAAPRPAPRCARAGCRPWAHGLPHRAERGERASCRTTLAPTSPAGARGAGSR